MRRLIDKDALFLKVQHATIDGKPTVVVPFVDVFEAQEVDAAPVVHGRWIHRSIHLGDCSNCGEIVSARHNYCPNCGAKMDLEVDGDG